MARSGSSSQNASSKDKLSLGTCSIDLSGPHEPTPRPGGQINKNPCHYFLVLTVRPDTTAQTHEVAIQTGSNDDQVAGPNDDQVDAVAYDPSTGHKPPLLYAALLGTKGEAATAVKHLLAQINNDHANFPTELVFRIHSDKGGEFINEELNKYCIERGIHKTTTAGYDPNANPAETAVGTLKRRARYLLSGARLPTNWWGMATLAAAQLCRADAGLEDFPRIPFGTRVMLVRDPTPKNAFVPRAEPGTVFGPSSSVSGGVWTYQKGIIKCRTNIAIQGMNQQDLSWVKVNINNWDPPDAPLPLPEPQLYDAASLIPVVPVNGAATRETASCPACLANRRKQKVDQRHSLIWGECLRATPPPLQPEDRLPDVVVPDADLPEEADNKVEEIMSDLEVEEPSEVSPIAARAVEPVELLSRFPTTEKLKEFPHASIATTASGIIGI